MGRFIKFIPYIFIVLFFCCLLLIIRTVFLPLESEKEYNYGNEIFFNCEDFSMKVGENVVLDVGFLSDNGSQLIEWKSSNPEVITVKDGVVQAVKLGDATITANFIEYGISRSCKINVIDSSFEINELVINQANVSLIEGESYILKANISSNNLNWKSSNENVATVKDGVVTAVGVGKATITVTTIDGKKTASAEITVKSKNTVVNVSGISLNSSNITMYTKKKKTIIATISPSNATNKNVTWSSNNENVATVKDGVVTAVGVGKATITVTTIDGKKTASAEITVKSKNTVVNVSGITLNSSNITMYTKEKKTIIATISPSNATNKNVTWSSNNENVVTVKDGVVTAVGVGKATITVTTIDGKKTASAEITVKSKNTVVNVSGISLNSSNITMYTKEKKTIIATISPSNATNKNVTWSSSNENVVTVKDGVVTAVGVGKATITVTTIDGKKTARCNVVVLKPELTISASSLTLIDEQTKKLTTSLSLKSVDQSVTWSSSNTSVATVDSNGKVHAKSVGTVTIKATSNYDSSISVKCTVTVRAARFLFVGNSKTYFPGTVDQDNGIPKRFKAIAKNAGYDIEYTSAVVGGRSLGQIINESDYPDRVNKIKSDYDYVILQEATEASYADKSAYYSAVSTIKNWVVQKNSNVEIYLRKLWVKIKQDENGKPAKGCTSTQIQTSYDNAEYIVNKLGIGIINDGPLFYDMLENYSSISIMRYQTESKTDYVHQNATGAYLSALCIYSEIYKKDPAKITYNDGNSSGTASILKTYAKKHCYNN